MAFVQQGPRRSSRFQQQEGNSGEDAIAAAAMQQQHQQQRRSGRISQTADGCSHLATLDNFVASSIAGDATSTLTSSFQSGGEDWSVVFPGRTRNGDGDGDDTAILRHSASSVTLAPLHDGTGQFAGDEPIRQDTGYTHDEYSLLFDDDGDGHGEREDGDGDALSSSASSSAGHPPSLLISTDDSTTSSSSNASPFPALQHTAHARRIQRNHSRSSQNSSSSSSGSAASAAFSLGEDIPSVSALEDNSPHWSWSHADHRRVLSSTTPRAGTPLPSLQDDAQRDVVDTDDDSDGDEVGLGLDHSLEDALESNPSALSAGFLPRQRRQAGRGGDRGVTALESIASASIVSSGVKRRHRRQAGSARSGKSRRSGDGGASLHKQDKEAAASTTISRPPPPSSRTQKVAHLLGRIFDVDDDVLDAVVYQRGPLAGGNDGDDEDEVRASPRSVSLGFAHDAAEIDSEYSGVRKGWRELIDGRIVEDEDEEAERDDTEEDKAQVDCNSRKVTASSRTASDDQEALPSPLPQALSIQEAVSAALSQWTTSDAGGNSNRDSFALSTSTAAAEALRGVLPYFVPFSWRLIMRLVRDWQQQQQRDKGDVGHSGKDMGADEEGNDTITASVASVLESSMMTATPPSSRGRSRERKALRGDDT